MLLLCMLEMGSSGYDGVYGQSDTKKHDSWNMQIGEDQEDLTWLI